jgi:hypothetical protein
LLFLESKRAVLTSTFIFYMMIYISSFLLIMQRLGDTNAFKDRNLRLKGADIATQRGWTGVPNFILESKEISVGAKLIYAMLLKYAREMDECFPGQKRLATDIGNSERSVRSWLKELKQFGLVSIKQRGQGRPNLYTVHLKASFWKKHRR